MRYRVSDEVRFFLLVWFYINVCLATAGFHQLQLLPNISGCNKPKVRAEYILPGFRIGCWLGEVPE